jgi:hypothetical protein
MEISRQPPTLQNSNTHIKMRCGLDGNFIGAREAPEAARQPTGFRLARIVGAPKATCGAPASDLLLHVSEEAWRRQRADERLFGHRSGGARRSGGGALDSRQLARDLRRVLTLQHRAHAGGRLVAQ